MRCEVQPQRLTLGYQRLTMALQHVTIRERILRKLLGGKIQTAIIIPGNDVKIFFDDYSPYPPEDDPLGILKGGDEDARKGATKVVRRRIKRVQRAVR